MSRETPGRGGSLGPLVALRKILPFEAAATSDRLAWVSLESARWCETPAIEFIPPAITSHRLVLYARPPEELDRLHEGVIGTEQTSKRVRCTSSITDLPLLRGCPTIQIASEEGVSTLDDLFPVAPTRLGKPGLGAATAGVRRACAPSG
jgi:hypothetical protein